MMTGMIERSNGRQDMVPSNSSVLLQTNGTVYIWVNNDNQTKRPCFVVVNYTKTTDLIGE